VRRGGGGHGEDGSVGKGPGAGRGGRGAGRAKKTGGRGGHVGIFWKAGESELKKACRQGGDTFYRIVERSVDKGEIRPDRGKGRRHVATMMVEGTLPSRALKQTSLTEGWRNGDCKM